MNTMKKEDMQKEQGKMIMQIGYLVMNMLQPVSQLLGAVGRVTYLQNQINLVTPKPEIKPQEKKDAEVDSKEAAS